ncbi:MAG TPA: hypothetical protein VIE44_05055 [Methylomirabilota bacterium]
MAHAPGALRPRNRVVPAALRAGDREVTLLFVDSEPPWVVDTQRSA